jgi:hypothetical protein
MVRVRVVGGVNRARAVRSRSTTTTITATHHRLTACAAAALHLPCAGGRGRAVFEQLLLAVR